MLRPLAVQATGPTHIHSRTAAFTGPAVKHAPDDPSVRVEGDRYRPLVLCRHHGKNRGAHGLALPHYEPRRVGPTGPLVSMYPWAGTRLARRISFDRPPAPAAPACRTLGAAERRSHSDRGPFSLPAKLGLKRLQIHGDEDEGATMGGNSTERACRYRTPGGSSEGI